MEVAAWWGVLLIALVLGGMGVAMIWMTRKR